MSTGSWERLAIDPNYEIWSLYPYPIRKIIGQRIIGQFERNNEYMACNISGKMCYVHRIIAEQWIAKSPGLTCVDHINHNRKDNRLSNLRWCSYKQNNNNKSTHAGRAIVYVDQIPPESILIDSYSKWLFENLYYDSVNNRFYYDNGLKFRVINPYCTKSGTFALGMSDVNNVHRVISLPKLKREYGL